MTTTKLKKLRTVSESKLKDRALRSVTSKPIKKYRLTKIYKIDANLGDSVELVAYNYIQALENALYCAGFLLEKTCKKIKICALSSSG